MNIAITDSRSSEPTTVSKPIDSVVIDEMIAIWRITDPSVETTEKLEAVLASAKRALESGDAKRAMEFLERKAAPKEIAAVVAELVAAWPQREKQDIAIFSRLMAEELLAANAGLDTIRRAGRALIRGNTFPPAIAEVLTGVAQLREFDLARSAMLMRLDAPVAALERILGNRRTVVATGAGRPGIPMAT